jgi:tetratricopeptide (TPR) repeat protein
MFLAITGRRAEALAEIAKINQLDYSFSSAIAESVTYQQLRDYPNLIEASKRGLLLAPQGWFFHYTLGIGYESTGQLQEAISEYQKAIAMSGGSESVVALAHAYAAIGKQAEAKKIFLDLERKAKNSPASTYTLATVYAGLNENDKAFEFLDKAYSEKFLDLPSLLKSDLALDGLRSDPRFPSLLRRTGLN